MSFFRQQRPRGFHHNYIYVDMRREKFRKLENRVRRRRGEDMSDCGQDRMQRGVFTGSVSHLRRRNERRYSDRMSFPSVFMIVLILILIFIWKILLTAW